ncbi:MAG: hypothetical protein HOP02_06190 [Methylococcaceae bacterium]|nr:hypothetical protein [Methylococcaceae bacterium]
MILKKQLIAEIEQIPDNKISEIYDLIHYFRLGLAQETTKTVQKPEEIFKLLTALTDDFMVNGREQLPLQIREDF